MKVDWGAQADRLWWRVAMLLVLGLWGAAATARKVYVREPAFRAAVPTSPAAPRAGQAYVPPNSPF